MMISQANALAPSANVVDEKKETLDWHWIGPAQGDERIRR